MPSLMKIDELNRQFISQITIDTIKWDFSVAKQLREKLIKAVAEIATGPVLIDLRLSRMIDSVGIGLIVATIVDLKKKGFASAVAYSNSNIGEVFETVNLEFLTQCIQIQND